jgi:hypothetical protein
VPTGDFDWLSQGNEVHGNAAGDTGPTASTVRGKEMA